MSLIQFLSHSRAGDAFREAVAAFCNERTSNALIRFNPGSPAVKVERTLTKLLKSHPEMEIDSVEIDAVAGCEYYRG
ncbi:MAG TPA: hypothetical protein VFI91_04475, partial [Longimicrobiaceae bacterium]|nr:hypothetical protein [Longimicrobiaceae bacterium]